MLYRILFEGWIRLEVDKICLPIIGCVSNYENDTFKFSRLFETFSLSNFFFFFFFKRSDFFSAFCNPVSLLLFGFLQSGVVSLAIPLYFQKITLNFFIFLTFHKILHSGSGIKDCSLKTYLELVLFSLYKKYNNWQNEQKWQSRVQKKEASKKVRD